MIIHRRLPDKTGYIMLELTEEEMWTAYLAQQRKLDMEDIDSWLQNHEATLSTIDREVLQEELRKNYDSRVGTDTNIEAAIMRLYHDRKEK